jgi:hypothetical protein
MSRNKPDTSSRCVCLRTRGKIPVGTQRICLEHFVRQIHPVWLFGQVPSGYWKEPENRRNYMLWLAHRLGFRSMRDWYRLTYKDIAGNSGGGLGILYWQSSPIRAVKECFPEYDWCEWLFAHVPKEFWNSSRNRRRYMTWLGEQLGFRRWEDWHRITTADFQQHHGAGLLFTTCSSASDMVMKSFPEHDWKPWMFVQVSPGFWDRTQNRRRYMTWLGRRLGYKGIGDWYRTKSEDFTNNYGSTLLHRFGGSVSQVVMALFPRRQWLEWKFAQAPHGFWDKPENRRRYVLWLGKQLGCRRVEDWRNVTRKDFEDNLGSGLIQKYTPSWDLLEECIPEWDWDLCRKAPLSIGQILAWADAHFGKYGKWPGQHSEKIDGTDESWMRVATAIRLGLRGLKRGTTLARLLDEHRGVRNQKDLPQLSERQIIAWAKAHFRATGNWPHQFSGRVIGTNGESWRIIARALKNGSRGLPGGLNVSKLLEKHGLR